MFGLSLSALGLALAARTSPTSKRGLIGVNNVDSFGDQPVLLAGPVVSWAMNYGTQPGNKSWFGDLEFVPQLWGGNDASTFQREVLANDPPSRHIYAFNEPDGTGSGQATMTPQMASDLWKRYVEPLKAHNISLGSPACTGTDGGIQWLKEFYGNCSSCTIDFITTHWYGSFEGLAAHLGNLHNTFNATPMWITELAIADASVQDTQYMFNTSIDWLDSLDWVDRYAWFGSFRSVRSNIGPNATFLDASGNLTTIGREYLYQQPSNAASNSSTTAVSAADATTATSSRETGGQGRILPSTFLCLCLILGSAL